MFIMPGPSARNIVSRRHILTLLLNKIQINRKHKFIICTERPIVIMYTCYRCNSMFLFKVQYVFFVFSLSHFNIILRFSKKTRN
jgi:hypothetical protein